MQREQLLVGDLQFRERCVEEVEGIYCFGGGSLHGLFGHGSVLMMGAAGSDAAGVTDCESSGFEKPTRMAIFRDAVGFLQVEEEDGLRDVFGQIGITRLSPSSRVDEADVGFNQLIVELGHV